MQNAKRTNGIPKTTGATIAKPETRGHFLELCAGQAPQLGQKDVCDDIEVARITQEDYFLGNVCFEKAFTAARKPATHVVVSLPCTGGRVGTWTFVNEKTPNAEQMIQEEQRKFFKLLRAAEFVCTVATEHGGWVTFELPRYNRYWSTAAVKSFCLRFKLQFAHLDVCAFGLHDRHGNLVKKPWRFASSCVPIHER